MIGISRILCGSAQWGDTLRYGTQRWDPSQPRTRPPDDKRPVVVWNMTKRCNLHCLHCYIDARAKAEPGELTTQEGRALIDDLADFQVPVLLFSGGEPLLREDLFLLAHYAVDRKIRAVLSTNGTLIDRQTALRLGEAGFSYVGVSLDGVDSTNDRFRGQRGAFQAALAGIQNCANAGIKVGLRFTVNRQNWGDIPQILDLLEEEGIQRCCFYHLVYTGRGARMMEEDVSHEETRQLMDLLCERALDFQRRGREIELLTVDNHADAAYLHLRIRREQPERAPEVLQLLRWNGGNSSGVGIGAVGPLGSVHADQFWQHYSFGNVRERRFSEIWSDTSDALMRGLKARRPLLKGRCASCRHLDLCNGNLRVRAEAVYGDVWAPDPACYLTETECGLDGEGAS